MDYELTIVSRCVVRANPGEWDAPAALFRRIEGEALEVLLDGLRGLSGNAASITRQSLRLFDIMLYVLGEDPLASALEVNTERFEELQALYYGALSSDKFSDLSCSTRTGIARGFYNQLVKVSKSCEVRMLDFKPNTVKLQDTYKSFFESQVLDQVAVKDMQPYWLLDKHGVPYQVQLDGMKSKLGPEFTTNFYNSIKGRAEGKAKDTALRDFANHFSRFIGHVDFEYKLRDFKLPNRVARILVDYMKFHFMRHDYAKLDDNKTALASLQKRWGKTLNYFSHLFKDGVMAMPLTPLPEGNPSLSYNPEIGHQKIATNADGKKEVVSKKLIIPVPLHLSDSEATKLIFEQLKADNDVIKNWLESELEILFSSFEKGKMLAADSEVHLVEEFCSESFDSKYTDKALENALAYYKKVHEGYCNTLSTDNLVFPNRFSSSLTKKEVNDTLGLPNREQAQVFMARLTQLSPQVTEAALADANLYDHNGKRINAVRTDGGTVISVRKDRAKGDWEPAHYKNDAAVLIEKWVEVTTPIRKFMRANGINGWQKLIVYLSSPLGSPAHFKRSSNMNSTFRFYAAKHKDTLGRLADLVTFSRIRSTNGVLVYMETKDLRKMSRALGNNESTTLRHYMPDSLWEYFSNRWIRIFQNLLIIDVVKDKPYMLEATDFETMEEVDDFMRNHSFTNPASPEDSGNDKEAAEADNSRLMVNASEGVFSVLKSISAAVEQALSVNAQIDGIALYWHEFTVELEKHISNCSYRDYKIKNLWKKAVINPEKFKGMVCDDKLSTC